MDPLACPDALAERRYEYGQAAMADGDAQAAADLFAQTLERVPGWAPAWFALGEAREKTGDTSGAAQAFQSALALDARDRLGAGLRLAHLQERDIAELPPAYVARLFDEYAPRFDRHLVETLAYRGPRLIVAALEKRAPGRRFSQALDLGCGSGLAAAALRDRVDSFHGVDLSPGMIAKARESGHYATLDIGDLVAFLRDRPPESADLSIAADALVYIGDLTLAFTAVAAVLKPGGLFAFTVERGETAFVLADTLRFRHSEAHLREAAAIAGLGVADIVPASTRREAGADVPGLVATLEKT